MTRLKLCFVQRLTDRHGQVRHYFRRPGYPRATLPGLPGSAEFMLAYQAALAGERVPIGVSRSAPGSLSALVAAYYASTEYQQLAKVTRATYRNICERLRSEHGEKPVAQLQREHIKRLMAAKAATPAAANALLKMLRILMAFAVEDSWRRDNPTIGIKRQRSSSEGFPTWSEEEIVQFEVRWPSGSRPRLALALALHVGQRRGDIVRMGRQHIQSGALAIRQSKTGARVLVPILPLLQVELDQVPADQMTFLLTSEGAPFSPAGFTNWFRECCNAAGLSGRSAHGLRKASATRFADVGVSAHGLMSIFGWKTLKEAERYTRHVDNARLARTAVAMLLAAKKAVGSE